MVMLGAMVLQMFFYTDSIATIGSIFGPIPQKLPHFQFPDFTSVNLLSLIKPACTIAILGAIESLLSATAIDVITNSKHNSNQELFGQGLANIIAPLFGGFASTGAIARSIKNTRSGANCPIAAIVHSLTLLCILVMFAPYASFIPLSALAAILFVVAFNMSEPAQFLQFLRLAPWYDIIVLLVTFLLTIFTDLVIAVIGGCIAAVFFFFIRLYQTCDTAFIPSKHLDMATYDPTSSKTESDSNRFGLKTLTFWANLAKPQVTLAHCENTVTCHLQGPLFFGIADKLQQALNFSETEPNCIIFDFSKVPFVDMTGLLMFAKIINRYQSKGIQWYIAHANPVVSKKLQAIGMYQINTIEE
jgi:sulfate permease, SulP family